MSLKETILGHMKEAMKAGEKEKKSALRMLLSEIQYAQTATDKSTELDDRALLTVIGRYKKKLEKSLPNYPDGDQKSALISEIAIVSEYLPKEATKAETEKAVDEVLSSTEERNFGALMKMTLGKLGSSGNAKLISETIKAKLS